MSRFGALCGEWSGWVAERLMATGCKPVAPWSYGGSNPPPSTIRFCKLCLGPSCSAGPRHTDLSFFHAGSAVVAQLVERVLGKDEVTGSSPVNGSSFLLLLTILTGKRFEHGKGKIRPQQTAHQYRDDRTYRSRQDDPDGGDHEGAGEAQSEEQIPELRFDR